jgi:hypothetical protein
VAWAELGSTGGGFEGLCGLGLPLGDGGLTPAVLPGPEAEPGCSPESGFWPAVPPACGGLCRPLPSLDERSPPPLAAVAVGPVVAAASPR